MIKTNFVSGWFYFERYMYVNFVCVLKS